MEPDADETSQIGGASHLVEWPQSTTQQKGADGLNVRIGTGAG